MIDMERKIGEIFENNGEWYQCIRSSDCPKCDLKSIKDCRLKFPCESLQRTDCEEVIFKKLEKVGEPITVNGKNVQLFKTTIANCDNCAFYKDVNCDFTCSPRKCHGGEEGTYVEIKQTKKGMEEITKNRIFQIASKYISGHITYDEFEEAMKNWVNGGKKESKSSLKEFDIEAAKSGKPVCTRDGRKARIICFDSNGGRPIVALVTECDDEEEIPYKYHCDGSYNCQSIPSDNDLMMLPEKKEGWVNVYNSLGVITFSHNPYDTKEEALASEMESPVLNKYYVDTVKVEWEE